MNMNNTNNSKINNPEILAPAGSLEGLYGALYAGADAVYVGAPRFSARAYAENPEISDLCEALDYAHLTNKKIYLALNTLLKNEEFDDALGIVDSMYKYGLDGIIVQDIGFLSVLHSYFPKLSLHGSTQLAINSVYGARQLTKLGVSRVVPSRELSINEIRELTKDGKDNGYEIECFIHGAMCYSYSGCCLFSSIAGGRSGNRGRCAGPCRKPYSVEKLKGDLSGANTAFYPISMKDMCVIESIEQLVYAGVDSFKIEGRMKAPEYAAGVSNIYRSAVDDVLSGTFSKKNASKYNTGLKELYIRSETSSGYLNQHNGKDMISLKSPAYKSATEETKKQIDECYINKFFKKSIDLEIKIKAGEELSLMASSGDNTVYVTGAVIENAKKQPTDDLSVKKQLCKTGGTFFETDNVCIINDQASFVPVSALNDIRRKALSELKELMLADYRFDDSNYSVYKTEHCNSEKQSNCGIKIFVSSVNQFNAVEKYSFYDIVAVDFCVADLIDVEAYNAVLSHGKKIYIKLPAVIRQKDILSIENKLAYIKDKYSGIFSGIYALSYDGLYLAEKLWDKSNIFIGGSVYAFNTESEKYILSHGSGYISSYELSGRELEEFNGNDKRECIVYGYIPLMYSANCVLKTVSGCDKTYQDIIYIKDENKRRFPVKLCHGNCMNIIYNCYPLDLSGKLSKIVLENKNIILDFTVEDFGETTRVLKEYDSFVKSSNDYKLNIFNNNEFTTGHFKRGVQ